MHLFTTVSIYFCTGKLYEGLNRQCCGTEVVTNDLMCCGNGTEGKTYIMDDDNFCCGNEYISQERSVCCVSQTGKAKVRHSFIPEEWKSSFFCFKESAS